MAVHLRCALFFLLNLRLTKKINKKMLKQFDKNLENPLTPKGPRHFLPPKPLKTAIFAAITKETKKNFLFKI